MKPHADKFPVNRNVIARARLIPLVCAICMLVLAAGAAPPTEWAVAVGGNGHFYEGVCVTGITWTAASNAAVSADGYLATIASQAENQFAFSVIDNDRFWHHFPSGNNHGPWLGGYQFPGAQEPAGGWVWVTGESFAYTNWYVGEPTGSWKGTNENRLQYSALSGTRAPTWNDLMDAPPANWALYGFLVEYDQQTPRIPNVTNVLVAEGSVILNWQRVGASAWYCVESVQSLDQTNWLPVVPTNQWPVATNVWAVPVSGAARAFYRVKALWTY